MQFSFYPTLEHACGHVRQCPHLGGAAIRALVQIANNSGQTVEPPHRQLDAERDRNHKLVDENTRREKELTQAMLELKLERARFLAAGLARSFVRSQPGFATGLVLPIAKSRK